MKSSLGTIVAFPFNVPMPYQIDPISGKLVPAPSLLAVPGQGAGPGGSPCPDCCSHDAHMWKRTRKFMRGLGQDGMDSMDGSGDIGGGPVGGDTGIGIDPGAIDFSGMISDSSAAAMVQPGGQFFDPVSVEQSQGSNISPVDTGWTTNADGSVSDSSGNTYWTDGTSMMADGTIYFADGSISYANGSYYDASTQSFYDANTGQWSDQTGHVSSAGGAGAGGVPSAGSGGGARGGGGAGAPATPRGASSGSQQSILCQIYPQMCAGGKTQQTPAGKATPTPSTASSAGSFLQKNQGWLIPVGLVAGGLLLLSYFPPQGGRR